VIKTLLQLLFTAVVACGAIVVGLGLVAIAALWPEVTLVVMLVVLVVMLLLVTRELIFDN
jgi:hypothetical protein